MDQNYRHWIFIILNMNIIPLEHLLLNSCQQKYWHDSCVNILFPVSMLLLLKHTAPLASTINTHLQFNKEIPIQFQISDSQYSYGLHENKV
jgi:hypothetical protein